MTNPPLIIARRIANLTDARYFAAQSVAQLGFCLTAGADGYLDPVYMQAMREWVEGPGIIGEFEAKTSIEEVNEAIRFFSLDGVIIPFESAFQKVAAPAVWIRLTLDQAIKNWNIAAAPPHFQGLILVLPGKETNWLPWADTLQKLQEQTDLFLEIRGDLDDTTAILEQLNPAGITLAGGEEEKIGVKLFDEADAIFGWLENL